VSGSNLYAGYAYTFEASWTSEVAKWDSSSWSVLGSFRAGPDVPPVVYALAVSGSDLYAGGGFTMAGGSPANRIAKWNGTSWSALGTGMSGGSSFPDVSALVVSGSDLYAGGSFTNAGGSPANYIAKWDGNSWSPLGSGMNRFGHVSALAVLGIDLYAGGGFTTAGGKASPYMAKARISGAAESITASGSSATIQFSGVVGYDYHVQRTDSLTPPMTWTTLTTSPISPAEDGSLTFTDTTAPAGTAYYRLLQN